MLYQLSYEATHWERGQFIEFISPVRSEMVWSMYKIIHIWTAVMDESEEWSWQFISNLSNCKDKVWKNQLTAYIWNNSYLNCGYGWKWRMIIAVNWFFQTSSFQLLKLEMNCHDHSSLSSITAVQIWLISYILHTISLLTEDIHELNKLTSLPMCGFIAQLVEHRTGIVEVTGSNPIENLIFSGFIFPIA